MDEKQLAYEADVKRMQATYGRDAEIPSNPYGRMNAMPIGMQGIGLNVPVQPVQPVQPIAARIADLGKQLAEAGHMLQEARSNAAQSTAHLRKCEAMFSQVSDDLMRAVNEHREGTPEGVPYPNS